MAEREIVFIDTHIVVWLYIGKKTFSKSTRELLSRATLKVSPMVRLELLMLFEKNKIDHPLKILKQLSFEFNLSEDKIDFSQLITKTSSLTFTRDPFDRMIVAHAKCRSKRLVSADSMILANFDEAVW